MTLLQYSNVTIIGILLIFTTTMSFLAGKPITEFQFWETHRDTWAPWICSALSVVMLLCTLGKQPFSSNSPVVQPLPFKMKANFIMGNYFIMFMAIASQILLWKINWDGRRSFELFVVSNLIMTTVFNVFISDRMIDVHADNRYQFLIPVFTLSATSFFIPYATPRDSWMYHYYYNLLIAACSVEIHSAVNDKILYVIPPQTRTVVLHEENSDLDYESTSSSDSEWEKVDVDEDDDQCTTI